MRQLSACQRAARSMPAVRRSANTRPHTGCGRRVCRGRRTGTWFWFCRVRRGVCRPTPAPSRPHLGCGARTFGAALRGAVVREMDLAHSLCRVESVLGAVLRHEPPIDKPARGFAAGAIVLDRVAYPRPTHMDGTEAGHALTALATASSATCRALYASSSSKLMESSNASASRDIGADSSSDSSAPSPSA